MGTRALRTERRTRTERDKLSRQRNKYAATPSQHIAARTRPDRRPHRPKNALKIRTGQVTNRTVRNQTSAGNEPAAHISNRYSGRLEFAVSHRKQTTAPSSNRHFFGVVTTPVVSQLKKTDSTSSPEKTLSARPGLEPKLQAAIHQSPLAHPHSPIMLFPAASKRSAA